MLLTAIDDLLDLMRRRVRLTYDVARWKWNHTAPIDHFAREEAILDAVESMAENLAVAPALARAFFRDQIEASKIYQRIQFERWSERERKEFTSVPDLHSDQRRALDALTKPLLLQLGIVLPLLSNHSALHIVQQLLLSVDADQITDRSISKRAFALLEHHARTLHSQRMQG
jgi:chorismate mutase-like protein